MANCVGGGLVLRSRDASLTKNCVVAVAHPFVPRWNLGKFHRPVSLETEHHGRRLGVSSKAGHIDGAAGGVARANATIGSTTGGCPRGGSTAHIEGGGLRGAGGTKAAAHRGDAATKAGSHGLHPGAGAEAVGYSWHLEGGHRGA